MLRIPILTSAMLAPAWLFARLQTQSFGQALNAQWIATLGLSPGADLLEVGCGPGRLASELAGQGFRVTAADRSPRMVRAAQRHCGQAVAVIEADATRLPFPAARFDAVIAASLLNVVPDPVPILNEFARICRCGAVISALVPTPAFTVGRATDLARSQGLDRLDRAILETWAGAARKTEPDQAMAWFRNAGLNGVRAMTLADGSFVAVSAKANPSAAHGESEQQQANAK